LSRAACPSFTAEASPVSADAGTADPAAGLLTVVAALVVVEAIPRAPAAVDFTIVSLAEIKNCEK